MNALPADQADLLDAVQRVAGVLIARQRGDHGDASTLLATFPDSNELTAAALMLAQLTLGLYARSAGLGFEEAAQDLTVALETAVG